ncbi:LysR family transcriptional regulator [bacterium M00.F.Ca.ET.228.01.1.1]|uniref:Transcriptional regulator, LysR family n=1 Tax=Burkholderia sp. (strain CCGE1003) TaxID=640512 RepID=E1TE29_BURSG|nr:LysR family transcriptional regulator [Paraburkholderia phenoliruptrix]MBW9127795.1 LysR family transcriptional regulator [Paraburkholderia ginsengiterrae]TGP47804.1 LysR family transcriptional regulator [bacterium M00.F.Ca.ET.228.01.1.1]TGS05596.1 LysR family transcriptional regulator [bacterium M00.F.Ca.ET.191.01.1.1]TGU10532.1 LysR family transcriptional regulator [bacterium M00.F.Ca.ET.155.01.1.1]MBW0445397.1 LysR family transcriptional regulator [Paraburkholderia phenoliruptrix]
MKNTLNVLLGKLRMKQLQLLIALDDQKSLHKAAGLMSMTQSAASKALQELESMFEAPLFERSKSGMIPNQLGHCVIRHARLVATDLTALCQDVAEIRSGRGGRLAIGAIMGAIAQCVIPAVNRLHAGYPKLSIEVVEDTSARMLAQLDDGRLDLVIGRAAVAADPSKYQYRPLADEPLSVVVGYAHPPWPKKELTLADLADHRWVMYPSHMPLHALLEREMDLAGLAMPDNRISTASTFVTVALLQSSADFVSLLPTAIAEMFIRQKMLRAVPVKLKSPSQTFGVVTRKGGVLSPPAERFVELLRQHAAMQEEARPDKPKPAPKRKQPVAPARRKAA